MLVKIKPVFRLTIEIILLVVTGIIVYRLGVEFFYKFIKYPQANISVSGTGSMYPTFPKGKGLTKEEREQELVADVKMVKYPNGIKIQNKEYYKSTINRGDIVSFTFNDKELIKRVIGLPGDKIELKGGLVYINDTPQKEPYTALPHSTFGGKSIEECKIHIIPESKYMVLGDNRKESDDSRFDVGFVEESAIDFFLPLDFQKGIWDKKWRDTTYDLDDSSKTTLDVKEFIKLLNNSRIEYKKNKLESKLELERSSLLRASEIIKTGIFEENMNGNLTIKESLKQVGYWRPVYGEIPVQGYFSAQELYNNLVEFDNTRKFILDNDFTEIGISIKEGDINNCPTQVIVIHFTGYIPPNYEKSTVESWKNLLINLNEIKPSWESAKNFGDFYTSNKRDIDKIVTIISDRIRKIEPIVKKMEENMWLNDEELLYLEKDKNLSDEQEALSKKLNGS